MRRRMPALILLGVLLIPVPAAWATTYTMDKDHTVIAFKIRHLFSRVEGTFNEFEGAFDYVPGHPEQWKAAATIKADSINTRVAERDNHLRSKDFFDAAQFPSLTFTSTQVTDATPTGAKLHGRLTIHGVEQPVVWDLQIHGEGKDPWGNVRSGFTATTTLNRQAFGIVWNKALETGQFLLGDDVDIVLEVEGISKGS